MNNLRYGDIVFCRGKGLIPSLIRLVDRGKFSHVTIIANDDSTNCLNAEWGQKLSIQPFNYSQQYEVVDIGLTDDEKRKMVDACLTLVGSGYDKRLILRDALRDIFGIDIKLNDPNRYICSEMVEIGLKSIGKLPENIYLKEYTPNGLYVYLKSKFTSNNIK